MTLIFDGSFRQGDVRTGVNSVTGAWTGSACLAQPDSFVVVPAPGGRTGYAGKFYVGVGSQYDCNGNQHTQLTYHGTVINSIVTPEVWYGFSLMLDSSWQPAPGGINFIGIATTSYYFTLPNTGLALELSRTSNAVQLMTNAYTGTEGSWYSLPVTHAVGVWYDWMYRVKLDRRTAAQGSQGFLEVYLRKPGETSYIMIFSKYNYQTEYPYVTPETNNIETRIGIYRESNSSNPPQTLYILNPKIGTTSADVKYIGSNPPPTCPQATLNMTL